MSVDTAKTARKNNSSAGQNKTMNEVKSKALNQRQMRTAKLPFLVELSFSLPVITILMVDFAVIGFSFAAGADWITILSRAMVATVVLGGLLAIIAFVISSTALAEAKERLEKARQELESPKLQEVETKEFKG